MAEEKNKHNWGRAYQCRYCLSSGKEYINEKARVENHIRNNHLRPDQLPFYCQLCKFHCMKRDELDNHVKNYKWHAKRLFDSSGSPISDSPSFLMENPEPYVIGFNDYIKLSKSDSDSYFSQKREAKRSSSITGDLLAQAVDVINSDFLQDSAIEYPQATSQGPGPLPDISTNPVEVTATPEALPLQGISTSTNQDVPSIPAEVTATYEAIPLVSVGPATQMKDAPTVSVSSQVNVPAVNLFPPQCQVAVQPVLDLMKALLETAMPGYSGPSRSVARPVSGSMLPSLETHKPVLRETVPSQSSQGITMTTTALDLRQSSKSQLDEPLDLSITETGHKSGRFNNLSKEPADDTDTMSRSTTPGSSVTISEAPDGTKPLPAENKEKQNQTEILSPKQGPSKLNTDSVEEENLMCQLLGEGERCILSPMRDDCRVVKLHKQKTENNTRAPEHFDTIMNTMREENRKLQEEIERNSRTVRCLEKTVEKEMKEQTKTLNSINDNLTNLITFLRTNAREERRRREREEDEKKEENERKQREEERKRKRDSHDYENYENQGACKFQSVLGEIRKNKKKK